jgi:nifR3 family TIM-barrel protein
MIEMTREVVKSTSIPVTVKTRLGWSQKEIRIVEVAQMIQETGIQALTIHGRTRDQMYRGTANWEYIAEVKNHPEINIPIIGNGDIRSPEDAWKAFKNFGVDGIMIGRAAVKNPWLFGMIKKYLRTGEIPEAPNISEKVTLARDHLNSSLELKGHPRGILEMRKHLAGYFKGLPHFGEIKRKLLTTLDSREMFSILDMIGERYGDFNPEQLSNQTYPGNDLDRE